jgi:hypothetical protein
VHRPAAQALQAVQRLAALDVTGRQAGANSHRRVCHVCQRQAALYTCPRCEAPYCSTACYQSHGESCTEAFFRDQVVEELQGSRVGDESKQHVASLLAQDSAARVADAEMLDAEGANLSVAALETAAALLDDDSLDGEERIAQVFGALTAEQQQSFARAISAGHVGGSRIKLAHWRPWWTTAPPALQTKHSPPAPAQRDGITEPPTPTPPLIVELSSEEAPAPATAASTQMPPTERGVAAEKISANVRVEGVAWGAEGAGEVFPVAPSEPPALPRNLPPLSSLRSGAPAPALSVHMVELLYAYAYSKLLYNGDWGSTQQDASDVAQCMLRISAVLCGSPQVASFENASDAVHSALERSLNPTVFDSSAFSVNVLQSVVAILRLGQGPLRALSDTHALFARACEKTQKPKTSPLESGPHHSAESKKFRRTLRSALHKTWFFVVWCGDVGATNPAQHTQYLELAHDVAQETDAAHAVTAAGAALREQRAQTAAAVSAQSSGVHDATTSVPDKQAADREEPQVAVRNASSSMEVSLNTIEEPHVEPGAVLATERVEPVSSLYGAQAVPQALATKLWPDALPGQTNQAISKTRTIKPLTLNRQKNAIGSTDEPEPEPEPEPQPDDGGVSHNPWLAKRQQRQQRHARPRR